VRITWLGIAAAWVVALGAAEAACGDSSTGGSSADGGGPDGDLTADATNGGGDGASADAAGSDAAHDGTTSEAGFDAASAPQGRVRVMAANITSGSAQSYEDPGIRIFQGIKPDVVLIQEFAYAGGLRALVDTAFGTDFSFYVEPPLTGGILNGIVSRWPIIESGTWTDPSVANRAFAWVHIDVPGPADLWAVSLHLLTTGVTQRDTEAKDLVADIQGKIPPGDFLVLGGDLNTDAVDEAAIMDLSAVVVTSAPYPADQSGNAFTSTNRNRPHDWVLASPSLQTRAIPLVIGASTYPSGLVFDSRIYTPLAEVAPVMMSDSAATGMQHMAVVRDFAIADTDAGVIADAGVDVDAGD
jgi:endonuclease/exonuclease/phosphatase family metal-dependent hydrolase